MKRLTCEMCGSTDLIKQDGVFVCQSCGCKYSVEEAKKMMVEVEGKVDVSGSTIKVDNTARLDNLYQIARRARDENNSENAAKYYDMVLVEDPNSWEASFYTVYYKAMSCTIAQIWTAAVSVKNCEESVLKLIRDRVNKDEQEAAVKEVVARCAIIANLLFSSAKSHYDGLSSSLRNDYTQELIQNTSAARDIMYNCGTQIEKMFGDQSFAYVAADAWKIGISLHKSMKAFSSDSSVEVKKMDPYIEKVGKYDANYAKEYFDRKRIERLKSDIAYQNNRISFENESSFMDYGYVVIAFIFSIGLLKVGMMFDVFPLNLIGLLPGVGLIGFCIYRLTALIKGKKEKQKTIREAEEEIDKKRQELADLNRRYR